MSNERKLRVSDSLPRRALLPAASAPMARSAAIRASSVPSIRKGPRMKPLEAPTSLMMAISRLRAVMARRMVLLMNTKATKVSSATSTTAAMRM